MSSTSPPVLRNNKSPVVSRSVSVNSSVAPSIQSPPFCAGSQKYARAIYDYAPKYADELQFEEEDIIEVFQGPEYEGDGWVYGELHDVWGWIPLSYVQILTDDEITAEGLNISRSSHSPSSSPNTVPMPVPRMRSVEILAKENTTAVVTNAIANTDGHSRYKKALPPPQIILQRPGSKSSVSKDERGLTDSSSSYGPHVTQLPSPIAATPRFATWADSVGGHDKVEELNLSQVEQKRQEVIHELVRTERDYIRDLGIIIEWFINPMRRGKFVRPKDVAYVFSNLEQLLPVNSELLRLLEERQMRSAVVHDIGDIFLRMSDYLKIYNIYCSNHPYAIVKLKQLSTQKQLAKFLESVPKSFVAATLSTPDPQMQLQLSLGLESFLLKPIQRICKYPLLLREVLKNTAVDSPDATDLEKALLKIETVVAIVNEATRQAEGVRQVLSLQERFSQKVNLVSPCRMLVRESGPSLHMWAKGDLKPRELFLFNDMVLVAKNLGDSKLKLVDTIPFEAIYVQDLDDTRDLQNSFEITHFGNKSKLRVVAGSKESKAEWLNAIRSAIFTFQSSKTGLPILNFQSTESWIERTEGKPDDALDQSSSKILVGGPEITRRLRDGKFADLDSAMSLVSSSPSSTDRQSSDAGASCDHDSQSRRQSLGLLTKYQLNAPTLDLNFSITLPGIGETENFESLRSSVRSAAMGIPQGTHKESAPTSSSFRDSPISNTKHAVDARELARYVDTPAAEAEHAYSKLTEKQFTDNQITSRHGQNTRSLPPLPNEMEACVDAPKRDISILVPLADTSNEASRSSSDAGSSLNLNGLSRLDVYRLFMTVRC
ncbi:cytochrome c oxidase subunit 1 [Gonapodya sp. JEL0774]|nr:cytochrome c oxidase subunit 1 [Gonapodya sp. JEL0774]